MYRGTSSQSNSEEQAAKKALNNYESSLKAKYGSSTDKVHEIIQRNDTFNKQALEVDEIKESRNIIAYGKKPKERSSTTLTERANQ